MRNLWPVTGPDVELVGLAVVVGTQHGVAARRISTIKARAAMKLEVLESQHDQLHVTVTFILQREIWRST